MLWWVLQILGWLTLGVLGFLIVGLICDIVRNRTPTQEIYISTLPTFVPSYVSEPEKIEMMKSKIVPVTLQELKIELGPCEAPLAKINAEGGIE